MAFLAEESEPLAVRIEVLDSSPLAPQYDLALIEESEKETGDQISTNREGSKSWCPGPALTSSRGRRSIGWNQCRARLQGRTPTSCRSGKAWPMDPSQIG